MKKLNWLACALAAAFFAALLLVGCAQGAASQIAVSVEIDGSEGGAGVIYDGEVQIAEGGSVYDALLATGVDVAVKQQSGMGVYVEGIGGLREKEKSANSGWLYTVNDKQPSVGCGDYVLSAGDKVSWTWKLDALAS